MNTRLGRQLGGYGLYLIARALVAYRPDAMEGIFRHMVIVCRNRGVIRHHEWQESTRIHNYEQGLEQPIQQWFIWTGELGGHSWYAPSPGETIGPPISGRGVGDNFLRRYLNRCARQDFPGQPRDPVPPGMDEIPVRRIRNALRASEPDRCLNLLADLRTELAKVGPECVSPAVLASARDHILRLRREFGADAHLPSALIAVVDLLNEIDKNHSPSGSYSPERNIKLLKPLLESKIKHPSRLTINIATMAIKMGFLSEVKAVVNSYREATSKARTDALSTADNEEMVSRLFEALPTVLAANDIFTAMKINAENAHDKQSPIDARIRKQADEELVRFSYAFSIDISHAFLGGLDEDWRTLTALVARGQEDMEKLRSYWRDSFTYPTTVIDRIFARVSGGFASTNQSGHPRPPPRP